MPGARHRGRLLPRSSIRAQAVVAIENYLVGTSQIAQTTLRSVLGQHSLDELLAERDEINEILQDIIDQQTEPWGVKVTVVEVKDVELPSGMQRAMARQAEAERERRAKIIGAEGEFEASEKLAQAAEVAVARARSALQLRYLQTLLEIALGEQRRRRSSRSRSTCSRRSPTPRSATPTAATRRRARTPDADSRPLRDARVAAWASGSIPSPGCGSSSRPDGLTVRARSSRPTPRACGRRPSSARSAPGTRTRRRRRRSCFPAARTRWARARRPEPATPRSSRRTARRRS